MSWPRSSWLTGLWVNFIFCLDHIGSILLFIFITTRLDRGLKSLGLGVKLSGWDCYFFYISYFFVLLIFFLIISFDIWFVKDWISLPFHIWCFNSNDLCHSYLSYTYQTRLGDKPGASLEPRVMWFNPGESFLCKNDIVPL